MVPTASSDETSRRQLHARWTAGPPLPRDAHDDAGGLEGGHVLEELVRFVGRPAQRMEDLALVHHLPEPGAARGGPLHREEQREQPLPLLPSRVLRQRLAETAKEREADEEGRAIDIPDDYVRGEQARMARAVLMAMEPDITIAGLVEAA